MSGTVQIDAIDSVSGNPGPLKKIGDALEVRQVASDVAVVESYFLNDGVTAKTAAALFTTADISGYSHAVVHISGLTIETIAITGLIDGTIETAALKSTTTAGVNAAASVLGNGTFYLTDLAVKNLKFTKSAAAEAATVTIAFKV